MIGRINGFYVLLLMLLWAGCGVLAPTTVEEAPVAPGAAYVRSSALEADLRRDVTTLSSDAMRGREAGTPGERSAAEYIADRLADAGVQPGGNAGSERSFFQEFDLRTTEFDTANTKLVLHGLGPAVLGRDWIAFPEHTPTVMMDSAEVVFAGFGIAAPQQGHDDYELISAGGKVVVAMAGAPEGLDSVQTFGGTFAAGDFTLKWIAAAQRGAAALVVIGEEEALSQWEDYATLARGRSMSRVTEESYVAVMPYLFVSESFGQQLLRELTLPDDDAESSLQETADSVSFSPTHTGRRVALHLLTRRDEAATQNVVGYLPGVADDSSFIAFGAHYDHLGTRPDGAIFNGADDNASGVAAVLAAARSLSMDAEAGRATERSLLFVFHAAEEKGLLGATHFTENPDDSVLGRMSNVAAHFNLDMVGREHPDSLHVVGAYRMSSALGALTDRVNASLGEDGPLFHFDRLYDDPADPERIFERSDHYRYAVKGTPTVFLTDGMGANWKKDSPEDDYHAVTDDADRIDYQKLARVSMLVYELARSAADTDAAFPIDGEIPQE